MRSSWYRASRPVTYSSIMLALRMSNDMDSGRHVDIDVAAVSSIVVWFWWGVESLFPAAVPGR